MSRLASGTRGWAIALAGAVLFTGVSAARPVPTTEACLAKKLREWGDLRRCEAMENGQALEGKPANPPNCRAKFGSKLAAISGQAAAAGVACRYGDNGDQTLTDYDTGLMWEKKTAATNGVCGDVNACPDPHGVGNSYSWSIDGTAPTGTAFTDFVAKLNADAVSTAGPVNGCFAGHCDWRLPLLVELTTIVDLTQGYCGGKAGACIDPLFGPTAASFHWTATTFADHPDGAFLVNFALDYVYPFYKQRAYSVRAVRGAL